MQSDPPPPSATPRPQLYILYKGDPPPPLALTVLQTTTMNAMCRGSPIAFCCCGFCVGADESFRGSFFLGHDSVMMWRKVGGRKHRKASTRQAYLAPPPGRGLVQRRRCGVPIARCPCASARASPQWRPAWESALRGLCPGPPARTRGREGGPHNVTLQSMPRYDPKRARIMFSDSSGPFGADTECRLRAVTWPQYPEAKRGGGGSETGVWGGRMVQQRPQRQQPATLWIGDPGPYLQWPTPPPPFGRCNPPPMEKQKRGAKTAAWWTFIQGKRREGQRSGDRPPAADENNESKGTPPPPPHAAGCSFRPCR